ncbi:MAG: DUF760 domain-containing protein [Prochloraceae cyanobacterium]|nr:DUF760 domain-containing protein [Prochloraceae cyanobacterium]
MNHITNPSPEVFHNPSGRNLLWEYLQSLDIETVAQLSQPSKEAIEIMGHNLAEILGNLPEEHFAVKISTSKKHLNTLLAKAMVSGYFLRQVEERIGLEKQFAVLGDEQEKKS